MSQTHGDDGTAPLYTVAIPVYNKAPYIRRCLDSVFCQAVQRFEVIVVDDASTDHGCDALASGGDTRVRVLRRPVASPGGYAARNLAVAEAAAPWIAFLDADDEWLPDHLAQIDRLRGQAGDDVGCLFAGFDSIFEDGRRVADPYSLRHGGRPHELDLRAYLTAWLEVGDSPVWTSAAVIRTDIVRAAGGFPADRCTRGGDKDAWLRVMARTRAMHTGRIGAVYRRDAANRATQEPPPNRQHCIRPTVGDLLKAEPRADVRRLLKRVANLELLGYARQVSWDRRPSSVMVRRFYPQASPKWFLVMLALWLWPGLRRLKARRLALTLVRPHRRDDAAWQAGEGPPGD